MKIDVSIGRKDHINVGDFSSVEPTSYLTAKDVDIEDSQDIYNCLSELLGIITASEFLKSFDEMRHLVKTNKVAEMYAEEINKCDLNHLFEEQIDNLKKYNKE